MEIDAHAPAITRQERFMTASPEEVFGLLQNVADWPRWQPEVSEAAVVGSDTMSTGTSFRWKSGGATIVSTVQVMDAPTVIGWTGRAVGTRAVHAWSLESVENGTIVRTEESMSGWLPRLLGPMVRRMLARGVTATLDALELETARG